MSKMADQRRETLVGMFPDYDVDSLLTSLTTDATVEEIEDWCKKNPEKIPLKRKARKRKHSSEPSPSPSGGDAAFHGDEQHYSDSDDLDADITDNGLILDQFVKDMLNELNKEMTLQDNKFEGNETAFKTFLASVFPKLRVNFIKNAYHESGSRIVASFIICFFVSNKLTHKLRNCMLNPESNMWTMTDPVVKLRKKNTLDIFKDDLGEYYPDSIKDPVKKFVKMMNEMAEKYPEIINRLELLPDAFELRIKDDVSQDAANDDTSHGDNDDTATFTQSESARAATTVPELPTHPLNPLESNQQPATNFTPNSSLNFPSLSLNTPERNPQEQEHTGFTPNSSHSSTPAPPFDTSEVEQEEQQQLEKIKYARSWLDQMKSNSEEKFIEDHMFDERSAELELGALGVDPNDLPTHFVSHLDRNFFSTSRPINHRSSPTILSQSIEVDDEPEEDDDNDAPYEIPPPPVKKQSYCSLI